MEQREIKECFAVMNNAYSRYSFPYFLQSMEKLGLKLVDLWGGIQHFNPFLADRAYIEKMKENLRARGMRIAAYTPEILAYPFNFASRDREVQKASLEYCRKNIQIAAELAAPVMLISPGYGLWDEPYEESFARSLESMRQAARIAETYGVQFTPPILERPSILGR